MATARIFALALLASVPSMLLGADASAATPTAPAATAKMSIKATVEHDGAKLDAAGTSTVGETARLRASDEAHAHDLSVTIVSKNDKGYAVKVAYKRDGKRIVKSKMLEFAGESATLDAGGSTITLSVAPAKTKRARIEMPEGDDPLAGL
ncbi:MAG: hypothetical protein ACRBN8_01030 [Nannocystales bacterium]